MKKEKGKNERMREPSRRWRCGKKERMWTKQCTHVWWIKYKREKKKKEKVTYGGKKKGKVLEITISKYYHNIFIVFSQ